MKYCFNSSFKQTILKCNFTERLKNCNLSQASSNKFYTNFPFEISTDKDLFFLIKWFQVVIFMFLFPNVKIDLFEDNEAVSSDELNDVNCSDCDVFTYSFSFELRIKLRK